MINLNQKSKPMKYININHLIKISILLICLGFGEFSSFAQLSGYQGKRFSLGYGGNIGYAMFSRNSEGSSLFGEGTNLELVDKLLSFNYKHQAQLELVTQSDMVVGIQASYGLTQFEAIKSGDEYEEIGAVDPYGYYTTNYVTLKSVYAKMKFYTLGLYIKSFDTKTAPIGKYNAYKLSALLYKPDLSTIDIPNEIKPVFPKYSKSLVFTYSRGISRVYFNRLLVDSNVELGIPLLMPKIDLFSLEENSDFSTDPVKNKALLTKRMNSRLWGNFLFNVNINISLLAF